MVINRGEWVQQGGCLSCLRYNWLLAVPIQILPLCFFEYFMGQCTMKARESSTRTYPHQREPAGTEALRDKNLPKLLFHATLANVRLKQFPYVKATAYFRVREGECFVLASKDCDDQGSIHWRINEAFDFQMTEYELRKQFLEVSIVREDGEQVGNIKINLFLIATGPFHQDFALSFPSQKTGRISFDIKLSQIVDLNIESLQSQVLLNKKHPGEEFCYSIKTINGFSGCSVESDLSYPAMVLLQNKKDDHGDSMDSLFEELQGLQKRKSLRELPKEIEEGGELKWGKDGGYLPVIETKVVASQIHNIYFQILIWRYKSELQTTKELFADTYVSLYKLLGMQAINSKEAGKEIEERKITMAQKIQHCGKNYGAGNFKFTITNQTYFKQYLLCVHTEEGILKTNPIFGIQCTTSTDKCQELQDLLTLSNSVEQNVIALNRMQTNDGSRQQMRRLIKEIEEQLNLIYQLLEKSSFSPSFLYSYSSQQQLLEGQKILVELGMKITQYIESQDPITNDLCWLILISLIKRGELNLNHMGFNDRQKKQLQSNSLDEMLQYKEEVANMFKGFLYKLLDLAINSINHKGSDFERTFAEIFSAFAYFCIPEFRKQILKLISQEVDNQAMDIRDIDIGPLDDFGESRPRDAPRDKSNAFREMFDWQFHFYKHLRRNDRIENNSMTIQEILSQETWKGRFLKRGLAFFYFLKYWVTYVESTLQDSHYTQWSYFPGYNKLIRAFLLELKVRPFLQYPDAIIEAALKLLSNEKLINPIVKIIVTKAKALETSEVVRAIEYLSLIFQSMGKKLKQLPISFNYHFFFNALTIVLDVDFSVAVSAILTLLYNNFSFFHIQFRTNISMYFLGKQFFRLFLHWSHSVRYVFHHFLAFKIYKDAMKQEPGADVSMISHQDIIKRYDEMMKILSLEVKDYKTKKKVLMHPSIEKQLFKKMKIKLYEKLKRKEELFQETKKYTQLIANKSIECLRDPSLNHQQSDTDSPVKGLEKSCSELGSKKIKLIRKEQQHTHKKQEIKRSSRFNEFSYVHDHIGKKSSLLYQIIPDKQFLIAEIEKEQLKQLESCFAAYHIVENNFVKDIETGKLEAPVIEQEISIDKREIRPSHYDDW